MKKAETRSDFIFMAVAFSYVFVQSMTFVYINEIKKEERDMQKIENLQEKPLVGHITKDQMEFIEWHMEELGIKKKSEYLRYLINEAMKLKKD